MRIEKEELLDCFFCKKEYHNQDVFGFIGFDKEEIEDVGLTKFFQKYPNILEDNEVVCNDCLNKHSDYKGWLY